MTEKERIGHLGETLSAKYLQKRGYRIIERNFKQLPWGEIDIIAQKEKYLFFVEVKTSTDFSSDYLVEKKIDSHKKNALRHIINIYLAKRHLPLDTWWQIDAIIVRINFSKKTFKLKHLENIFY